MTVHIDVARQAVVQLKRMIKQSYNVGNWPQLQSKNAHKQEL
jgi:hypothetical protein